MPHAYFKTNTFDEYLAMLRTFCDMTGREDLYEQNGLAVQQQISDVLELVQNAKLPAPMCCCYGRIPPAARQRQR